MSNITIKLIITRVFTICIYFIHTTHFDGHYSICLFDVKMSVKLSSNKMKTSKPYSVVSVIFSFVFLGQSVSYAFGQNSHIPK